MSIEGNGKFKIKVKYFFDFRVITGKKEIEIEIEKGVNIKELIKLLETIFPKIKEITKYPEDFGILLNGEHAKVTTCLKHKDVIDLFTIIDGG